MSVRFTLKELRCEFSSSFDIMSAYVWNEKKNESKRKQRAPEFFHKQEDKSQFSNLTINKTSR